MKPITIYRYDKSISGKSPRISEHLPPRISFRRFASHQFVAYVVIAILISKLFDYSLTTIVFFVIFCWFCVTCFKAFIDQTHIYEHNSFNDSTLTDSF